MSKERQLHLLRNRPLLALGAGHGMVDLCANTLPVFYPMLMATLNLSYASVGALATVQWTTSSLCQPIFGWLADRFGGRALAPLGVLAAVSAIALAGLAPSYHTLLLVVALLGLAVAVYHPQGAKTASILGGKWRTTALSVYMMGGSGGFSLGPLLAAIVLVPAGLTSTRVLVLPGLLVALVLFVTLGRVDRVVSAGGVRAPGGDAVRIAWLGVVALGFVIIIRSWVNSGLIAFIPLLYAARGDAPELAGKVLFLTLFMEGIGTALGGWLADRVGRRLTLVVSFLLLAPSVHLFLGATELAALALAVAIGLLLGCSVTLTLVAAQEVLPSRMGMASGIAISLSNIMSGIGVGSQGLMADRFGLLPSMEVLAVAVVAAAAASLAMPDRARRAAIAGLRA